MAFKTLSLSTTNKTLPEPAYIHNPTASSITLTVTMNSELFSTLKSAASLIDRPYTLPTLLAAQAATDYTTTSSGRGSGAQLTITTGNVGSDLGDFVNGATGVIFGGDALGKDYQTYTATGGSGTGFQASFQVRGTAVAQVVEGLEIINAGTGYAVGDVLTFTNSDTTTFTRTLTAGDISDVFQPTAIAVKAGALGDNYKAGDWLYVTLSQTIELVEYTFPLELQIKAADLTTTTFDYILASGKTTPFQAETIKAGASTTILAIS
jgi:hypothetical protein